MEKQHIKLLIASKLSALEQEWKKMVDKEDRVNAADYLKVGVVEGKINALIELLTEIDRIKE
ncbi:MAG: hypothetical protein ACK52I_00950 [Pseudomonadota bacterium]|jgi:hypothetical protein